MNSNIKILPGPDPIPTFFSPPFSCPFYLHVSNAGENITCRDPIIGMGEPGKVIPKLCRFSNLSSSPANPLGGVVTYKCVGSQWEVKKSDCISAPINSLLQLAKVILKPLTLRSSWGHLSGLSCLSTKENGLWAGLCCSQNYFYLFFCKKKRTNWEMLKNWFKYKYGGNKICVLL